jgi:hypothetical protein
VQDNYQRQVNDQAKVKDRVKEDLITDTVDGIMVMVAIGMVVIFGVLVLLQDYFYGQVVITEALTIIKVNYVQKMVLIGTHVQQQHIQQQMQQHLHKTKKREGFFENPFLHYEGGIMKYKNYSNYLFFVMLLLTSFHLFAPWGGSTIYNGDSHSSVPAFGGYMFGTPGRVRDMLDPDLGPSKIDSYTPCRYTCEGDYGPCTQKDWKYLK